MVCDAAVLNVPSLRMPKMACREGRVCWVRYKSVKALGRGQRMARELSKSNMSQKREISSEEWEAKLRDVWVSKEDLNKLVMNYLVIEGYKDAAEEFERETGTSPGLHLGSIGERMSIRSCLQSGEVQTAVSKVNDLDPELLDSNPRLAFRLQLQQLIELLRSGKVDEALEWAREDLVPRTEENPELLAELEACMGLLAFPDISNCPASDLLSQSHRHDLASQLNAAILASQCQEQEPRLPALLKALVWAQEKLGEKVKFPAWTEADWSAAKPSNSSSATAETEDTAGDAESAQ